MRITAVSVAVCVSLFIAMLLLAWGGHRFSAWRVKHGAQGDANSAVTGAVFALLGLLTAFTFAGAFSRFDERRNILVEETNALSTAYSRIDLMPAQHQPELRTLFKRYADTRAGLFPVLNDPPTARRLSQQSQQLQNQIWAQANRALPDSTSTTAAMLFIPALNDMFDISTRRYIAIQTHPPLLIFIVLSAVGLTCAAFIGFSAPNRKKFSPLHTVAFAAMTSFILYVILDVEFARFGLVTLHSVNQLLVDFAASLP